MTIWTEEIKTECKEHEDKLNRLTAIDRIKVSREWKQACYGLYCIWTFSKLLHDFVHFMVGKTSHAPSVTDMAQVCSSALSLTAMDSLTCACGPILHQRVPSGTGALKGALTVETPACALLSGRCKALVHI